MGESGPNSNNVSLDKSSHETASLVHSLSESVSSQVCIDISIKRSLADLCYLKPPHFPQIDIIGAVVIVWRVRGKTIRSVLCNIVCNNCAQHNEMHTHIYRLTVLWIGFCLTGPISLCLDSFLHVLCVLLYTVCMCRFVTR